MKGFLSDKLSIKTKQNESDRRYKTSCRVSFRGVIHFFFFNERDEPTVA